ncbi:efflux RND transporter permease subunit [Blastococcus atacamensis]|uniref:efflux RND transporter permease subunit n=1 Tax=Blastococcus atacamensis TaxID=2070508 RepID=UPI0018E45011|nr:efflux RND transporter permease subunit [Blastococcus atacamensis]
MPNAVLDVWQADTEGAYESQIPDIDEARLRAKYTTREDGTYCVRTIAPLGYAIPMDGPVGDLISRTGISHFRPAHVHFLIDVPGYEPLITHLFQGGGGPPGQRRRLRDEAGAGHRLRGARAGADAGRRFQRRAVAGVAVRLRAPAAGLIGAPRPGPPGRGAHRRWVCDGVRAAGGGVFISQPLALVVIGGLISSTLLTLLLVPVLYTALESRRGRRREKRARAGPPGSRPPTDAHGTPGRGRPVGRSDDRRRATVRRRSDRTDRVGET